MYVGNSADTPPLAVDRIAAWWQTEGRQLFPDAPARLILVEAGGRQGGRPRLGQVQLPEQVADRLG